MFASVQTHADAARISHWHAYAEAAKHKGIVTVDDVVQEVSPMAYGTDGRLSLIIRIYCQRRTASASLPSAQETE